MRTPNGATHCDFCSNRNANGSACALPLFQEILIRCFGSFGWITLLTLGGEPSGPGSETILTLSVPNAAASRACVVSCAEDRIFDEMTNGRRLPA